MAVSGALPGFSVQPVPTRTLPQSILHVLLAFFVLFFLLLSFVALKNQGIVDFGDINGMLGVAFKGKSPIIPGQKRPGRLVGGAAVPLSSWTEFLDGQAPAWWDDDASAGIGVLCGR